MSPARSIAVPPCNETMTPIRIFRALVESRQRRHSLGPSLVSKLTSINPGRDHAHLFTLSLWSPFAVISSSTLATSVDRGSRSRGSPPPGCRIRRSHSRQDIRAKRRKELMNPLLLRSLEWRLIGPHRGGRVVAVAGHPTEVGTFYFGACAGGVWKTTSGGAYWENISDGFFRTAAIGAIAVSEADPNVIYVGTGETAIRSNVSHGDGVYRSSDGGHTWQNVGLGDTRHIGDIVIHPRNPDVVYVAALGHAWGTNEERGVFRSTDGGRTWKKVLYKSDRAGAVDLAMDPHNPRILYASIWQAQRFPYALSSGGEDSGLWRT